MAAFGEPAYQPGRNYEADEVTPGGAGENLDACGAVGENGGTEGSDCHVEQLSGGAELPSKGSAGEENGKGLAGDGHGGEGEGYPHLRRQGGYRGGRSNQEDRNDCRAG